MNQTMICLQKKLVRGVSARSTCRAIETAAFNSHPDCYVASGFCDLPSGDLTATMKVIGPGMTDSPTIIQMVKTSALCLLRDPITWPVNAAMAGLNVALGGVGAS